MDYHSTGLLNWQTKATRMVGSRTGIRVRTSFRWVNILNDQRHPSKAILWNRWAVLMYDHSEQGNATNTCMPD